jgi:hypothetical protein
MKILSILAASLLMLEIHCMDRVILRDPIEKKTGHPAAVEIQALAHHLKTYPVNSLTHLPPHLQKYEKLIRRVIDAHGVLQLAFSQALIDYSSGNQCPLLLSDLKAIAELTYETTLPAIDDLPLTILKPLSALVANSQGSLHLLACALARHAMHVSTPEALETLFNHLVLLARFGLSGNVCLRGQETRIDTHAGTDDEQISLIPLADAVIIEFIAADHLTAPKFYKIIHLLFKAGLNPHATHSRYYREISSARNKHEVTQTMTPLFKEVEGDEPILFNFIARIVDHLDKGTNVFTHKLKFFKGILRLFVTHGFDLKTTYQKKTVHDFISAEIKRFKEAGAPAPAEILKLLREEFSKNPSHSEPH